MECAHCVQVPQLTNTRYQPEQGDNRLWSWSSGRPIRKEKGQSAFTPSYKESCRDSEDHQSAESDRTAHSQSNDEGMPGNGISITCFLEWRTEASRQKRVALTHRLECRTGGPSQDRPLIPALHISDHVTTRADRKYWYSQGHPQSCSKSRRHQSPLAAFLEGQRSRSWFGWWFSWFKIEDGFRLGSLVVRSPAQWGEADDCSFPFSIPSKMM